MVLLVGPYSVGKTTFIQYLLGETAPRDLCGGRLVSRPFQVRFGPTIVPTTRTVRGFSEHFRSSSPDTVSPILNKKKRNCKSLQVARSPACESDPSPPRTASAKAPANILSACERPRETTRAQEDARARGADSKRRR